MFDKVSLGTALALRDVLHSDEPVQDKIKILQRVEVNADSSVPAILRAKDFESLMGEKEAQNLRSAFTQSIGPMFKSSPMVHARDTINRVDDLLNRILSGIPVQDAEWEDLERHRIALPKFSAAFSNILMENNELRGIYLKNRQRLDHIFDKSFKRPGTTADASPEQDGPDIESAEQSLAVMAAKPTASPLGLGAFDKQRTGVLTRRAEKLGMRETAPDNSDAAFAGQPDTQEDAGSAQDPGINARDETGDEAVGYAGTPSNRYEEDYSGEEPLHNAEGSADDAVSQSDAAENGSLTSESSLVLTDEEQDRISQAIMAVGYEGDLDADPSPFSSEHEDGSRLFLEDQMLFEENSLKRNRAMSIRARMLEEISAEREAAKTKEEPEDAGADVPAEDADEAEVASGDRLKSQAQVIALTADLGAANEELGQLRETAAERSALIETQNVEIEALKKSLEEAQSEEASNQLQERIAELESELESRPAFEGEHRKRLATMLTEEMAAEMLKTLPAIPEGIKGVDIPYSRVLMFRHVIHMLRIRKARDTGGDQEDGAKIDEREEQRRFLMEASISVLDGWLDSNYAAVFGAAMDSLKLDHDSEFDQVLEDTDVISFLKFFQVSQPGEGNDGQEMFINTLVELKHAGDAVERLHEKGIDSVDTLFENMRQIGEELAEARAEIQSLNETIARNSHGNHGRGVPAPQIENPTPLPKKFLNSSQVVALLVEECDAQRMRKNLLHIDNVVFYVQSDEDEDMVSRGGAELEFRDAVKADHSVLVENRVDEFCVVCRGDPNAFTETIREIIGRATIHSVSFSRDAILKQINDIKRAHEKRN